MVGRLPSRPRRLPGLSDPFWNYSLEAEAGISQQAVSFAVITVDQGPAEIPVFNASGEPFDRFPHVIEKGVFIALGQEGFS